MKVEIWSDIMCPFCYIGKRRFESALDKFEHKDAITVEWKSFQLAPDLVSNPALNSIEHLAESKGWTKEHAKSMTNHVTEMAAGEGLKYNFDITVVANSHNAHELLHLAKEAGKQDELKEYLLAAYFIKGKNIDDLAFLIEAGESVGLSRDKIEHAFENKTFKQAVDQDVQEASQLGVTGVPFFVFDRKYGISGAQEVAAFTQTLEQAYSEWQLANPTNKLKVTEGDSCDVDGNCD